MEPLDGLKSSEPLKPFGGKIGVLQFGSDNVYRGVGFGVLWWKVNVGGVLAEEGDGSVMIVFCVSRFVAG